MNKRSVWLCTAALFAALTAVGSWISVPSAVPFTLQSFIVYLMLLLLPPACSLLSIAVYLFLGAVGLPVFAGFQGGLSVLLGPLGGFLWGFLGMALIFRLWNPKTSRTRLICAVVGTLLCYALGTVQYTLYTAPTLEGFVSALLFTVVPFVVVDALKLLLAWQIAKRLRPRLPL